MTLSSNQFQEKFTISGSSTNSLDLPFKFFADSEIKVTVNGTAFTAFTLEGAGRDSGVRRLTRTSGNFADADSVVVTRIVDGLQDFDPSTGQILDVEGIEDALDKATGFAQQALRVDTTNGQTYDASIDGSSAQIVNVATGTADNHAVNKAQLDAAIAGTVGTASVTIPTPDSGSGDDNKILAVSGTGYALQTPTQIRNDLDLGTSDNVTHANVTASGTLDVTGNATFGADVNVGDDLQLPAAGHIKAASGGVGINVDSSSAGGTFHVRKSGSASSFPSGTNVVVAEAGDADFNAITVMGPSRANGQEHDIRFAAADSVGLTTAIRSTRGASQPADSLSLIANSKEIVKVSSDGTDGLLDLSGGGTSGLTLISGVHEPSASTDAATKNYVDSQITSQESNVSIIKTQSNQVRSGFGGSTGKSHSLLPLAGGSGSYLGISGLTVDTSAQKVVVPVGTYIVQGELEANATTDQIQSGPCLALTSSFHSDKGSLTDILVGAGGGELRSNPNTHETNPRRPYAGVSFKGILQVTGSSQDVFITMAASRINDGQSFALYLKATIMFQKIA